MSYRKEIERITGEAASEFRGYLEGLDHADLRNQLVRWPGILSADELAELSGDPTLKRRLKRVRRLLIEEMRQRLEALSLEDTRAILMVQAEHMDAVDLDDLMSQLAEVRGTLQDHVPPETN